MRFTIIPDEQKVTVDGVAIMPLDMTGIPPGIHAIQGYDTHIEIEYKEFFDTEQMRPVRQANSFSTDFTPYAALLTAHAAEKQRREEERAAREAEMAARIAALQAASPQ